MAQRPLCFAVTWQTQNTPILSLTADTCSVLDNLSLCSWIYSSAGLCNQSLLGAGSLRGYPSVICGRAAAMLVILLLFYQDRNSSIMSFRKQSGRENNPIASLCSQRLMALNFVKQKTIKGTKPCQTKNISSSKSRIYNKETREWWIRECGQVCNSAHAWLWLML